MIWKHKLQPTLGDARLVRRFAWLPVHLDQFGFSLWLEPYQEVQAYMAIGIGMLRRHEWVTVDVVPADYRMPPELKAQIRLTYGELPA